MQQKSKEEIIKQRYPFYNPDMAMKDVALNGEQVMELMESYLSQYRSQTTSEEYKLETGDGYGTTYAASQPPHGTASGGYSREDMEKAFTEGMNFDINDLPTPRVHFDNFINSLHPETK